MRIGLIVSGLLLSMGAAHADKVVASGRPLLLYQAYSTNPDCSSAGTVISSASMTSQADWIDECAP